MIEDAIPKWTKVTVYENSSWSDTSITVPVLYKGYLLSFVGTVNDRSVQIINKNGQVIVSHVDYVQFNLGEVFNPNKKDLIPEGTRVICYDGNSWDTNTTRQQQCCANFLRFGLDCNSNGNGNSFTTVIVLRDNGQIDSFPVGYIQICTEEDKDENPILNRLRAIDG